MLPIFKRRKNDGFEQRFATFSEQLAQAFAQIKTDIGEVNTRLDSNQKELERVGQWVDYLNRSNQRISDSHSRLWKKQEKIAENHLRLHSSHSDLRSEHSATARKAQNLENRHEELSKTISAHGEGLKIDLYGQLREHKESSEEELNRLKLWIDYFSTYIERQKRKEGDIKEDLQQASKEWDHTYSALRELLNGLQGETVELKSSMSTLQVEMQDEISSSKEALENSYDSTKNHINSTKSELSEQILDLKTLSDQASKDISRIQEKIAEARKIQEVRAKAPQQVISAPVSAPPPAPAVHSTIPSQAPQFQATTSSFQRHIMSRVMPNRRGYVLKFIIDLVKDNQYSTKEIEEIVVNEKQLCGRTSFYAYLKELKLKGRIAYAVIDERAILVSTGTQQTLQ